jgi:hypothetical protein
MLPCYLQRFRISPISARATKISFNRALLLGEPRSLYSPLPDIRRPREEPMRSRIAFRKTQRNQQQIDSGR